MWDRDKGMYVTDVGNGTSEVAEAVKIGTRSVHEPTLSQILEVGWRSAGSNIITEKNHVKVYDRHLAMFAKKTDFEINLVQSVRHS